MNATPKSERKAPDPTVSPAASPSEATAGGAVGSASARSGSESNETAGSRELPSSGVQDDASTAGDVAAGGKKARAASTAKKAATARETPQPNNVRKLRQNAMMSKAELARRAGVSPLTIDRVEAGYPCRMDTKRKILEALGLSPSARAEVWPDID